MTIEELKQYDDLGDTSKHLYQDIKSQHPDWSHKQIMAKLAIHDFIESHLETRDSIDGGVGYGESLWDKLKNFFR